MAKTIQTISPVNGEIYVEREQLSTSGVDRALDAASRAQRAWRKTSLADRAKLMRAFIAAFEAKTPEISEELSWQMGRPIRFGPIEVRGTKERALKMIDLAEEGLADIVPAAKDGFRRYIKRAPLGVVVVVPAWNYPYLIAINSVVPALMAGNAVILKPSSQTQLCGERFAAAFDAAGLPEGLFTCIHLDHAGTEQLVQDSRVDFVAFTGSVPGGRAVQRAARERFVGVGLELGGKDPAYVRADSDVANAAENLADGAFFNSGQSCCGIERVYAHADIYDSLVEAVVSHADALVVGNPLDEATTMGPLARESGAKFVRSHVEKALAAGARGLVDASKFSAVSESPFYCAPQVLVDVDHSMDVMMEETFGPVVGIMRVTSDDEAVRLMNDSPFGLTASVWTADEKRGEEIGADLDTGTVFVNRCDYLDPELAWVGVKDSGRGCTLSVAGYEHLTRPKSFHIKNG